MHGVSTRCKFVEGGSVVWMLREVCSTPAPKVCISWFSASSRVFKYWAVSVDSAKDMAVYLSSIHAIKGKGREQQP